MDERRALENDGSQRPVIDFDHHSPNHARTWLQSYDALRSQCPVAWSTCYGGFWLLTRYSEVAVVARDDLTFSSDNDVEGTRGGGQGIMIPHDRVRSIPIELDPPEFQKYRRLLSPAFSPGALARWEPFLRDLVINTLEVMRPTGSIDLILDLANPVPAKFTMAFLGFRLDDWEQFATPLHDAVAYPPETKEHERAVEGQAWIMNRIQQEIDERRSTPRDDLTTKLVQAEVEGEPISQQYIIEMIYLILAGGVDTTTALLGHAFRHLSADSVDRELLLAHPDLIPSACEEFLRYFSPTQNLARTVTRKVEVAGHLMSPGERVLMSWAAINHDPAEFERPNDLILDRIPNRHAAFGLGAHRCLGSNFTRIEFRIIMEEVLKRMPDFTVDESRTVPYATIGAVNGFRSMPATFTGWNDSAPSC